MTNIDLNFDLPLPWKGQTFAYNRIGSVNFLVGPNGTGKSRFGKELASKLSNSRLLGADRLRGMEGDNTLKRLYGDNFAAGIAKSHFSYIRAAGGDGLGLDSFILLEERMDLRVQVEATISHLFSRRVSLEWDSGNLVPRATLEGEGGTYRLDREECHGIKELLVLLTHLYNDEYAYLIIDEPELNLHPQFQAFLMQEVRKVAGDHSLDSKKKTVFLITHSPFILDFRSLDDVKSVLSFSLDYSTPRFLGDIDQESTTRITSIVPRLNVHHKQLFFSDSPIFVEGVLDAQMVEMIQAARGASVAAAGSCVIDAGGSEEVNKYLTLCLALGKSAHFLYDLDSLFFGSLRSCVKSEESVTSFLATAGVGHNFSKYCGELERKLTDIIDIICASKVVPPALDGLFNFLNELGDKRSWDGRKHARARVAVLTAISRFRSALEAIVSKRDIEEIDGRLGKVVAALESKNIHLLSGGTLERYLPSYTGDPYKITDEGKKQAVAGEMEALALLQEGETSLETRYGLLYKKICLLPSRVAVDVERVLRDYLGRYIHDLQAAIAGNHAWDLTQLRAHLSVTQKAAERVFRLKDFSRTSSKEFSATVLVDLPGGEPRIVRVTHLTNAGMGEYRLEPVAPGSGS